MAEILDPQQVFAWVLDPDLHLEVTHRLPDSVVYFRGQLPSVEALVYQPHAHDKRAAVQRAVLVIINQVPNL